MSSTELTVNRTPGTLTVYSDIGCPWASLALHGLRRAGADGWLPLGIDHRVFSLELVNRRPTPKHTLDAEIPVVGGLDDTLEWQVWRGHDAEYPVTTLPAMEAVQAAKAPEIGGLAASDQLDAALRRAFYAESRCISILPVILEVAESCPDVDHERLTAALHAGRGRAESISQTEAARDGRFAGGEVKGSPHIFAPDGHAWHNPGIGVRWAGAKGAQLPVVTAYNPVIYDDIVCAATSAELSGGRAR